MICPVCNKEFAPNPARPNQRYCSRRCTTRAAAHRQTRRITAERRALREKFVCTVCGKAFVAGNTRAKYCSVRCASEALRRRHGIMPTGQKVCQSCGRTFVAGSNAQRHCPECREKRILARRMAAAEQRAQRDRSVCPVCGKEFEATHHLACYCSRQCRRKAENDKEKAARLAARSNKVCPVCGVTFTPKRGNAIFCSVNCKSRDYRQSRRQSPMRISATPRPVNSALFAMERRVSAYLALPAAERWARRGELTKKELSLAEKMWTERHNSRAISWNWLPR